METKRVNKGLIVFVAVLILLFIPIISDYIKSLNIEVLSEKGLTTKLESKESFVLFIGDVDKNIKKDLINIRNMMTEESIFEYSVYSIKNSSVSKDLKSKSVAIYIDGDLQKTYKKFNKDSITNDVNSYYIGTFDDSNTYFKVAENYNAYRKIVNSDVVTMAVFGRNSCGWCNKFKPVYNAIAEKYGIDIYYFDSDSYNTSDYTKIINMDLTVPAKCSSDATEFKLSDGFGTPLTIFTKKGKIVDCIGGYSNRESLLEILKNNEIISE